MPNIPLDTSSTTTTTSTTNLSKEAYTLPNILLNISTTTNTSVSESITIEDDVEITNYSRDVDYNTMLDFQTNPHYDPRTCELCTKRGDFYLRGRLLPVKNDMWVHSNCALWSSEVGILEGNELIGVPESITRGRNQVCHFCGEDGATLGCNVPVCKMNYHVICAIRANCRFSMKGNENWIHCYKHAIVVEGLASHQKESAPSSRKKKTKVDSDTTSSSCTCDDDNDDEDILGNKLFPEVKSSLKDDEKTKNSKAPTEEVDLIEVDDEDVFGNKIYDKEKEKEGKVENEKIEDMIIEELNEDKGVRIEEDSTTKTNIDATKQKYTHTFKTPLDYFLHWRTLFIDPCRAKLFFSQRKGADKNEEDGLTCRHRLGALTICSLGRIECRSEHFHTPDVLYPHGYLAKRSYWSCTKLFDELLVADEISDKKIIRTKPHHDFALCRPCFRQCVYTLSVLDDGISRPLFKIESEDDPSNPIISYHPDLAHTKLIAKINATRKRLIESKNLKLQNYELKKKVRGEYFFGFALPEIAEILERIPATNFCHKYTPKFGFSLKIPKKLYLLVAGGYDLKTDFGLNDNSEGSARLQGYFAMTQKSKDQFLDSFYFNSVNSFRLPKEMKDILKSKNSERPLELGQAPPQKKLRSKLTLTTEGYDDMLEKNQTGMRVQVLRSTIEGWGVYAKQYIKKGEIIIEYVGEVIDDALADLREAYYNSKNIGCYMFRIPDSSLIVDATMRGSIARFINHSCTPNAKTDAIKYHDIPKIVIYAIKDILPGEEIAYDYMFAEGEGELVPCYCGSRDCKGYMNVA